ncbi:hypothetical protein PRIPAC_78202 [Pristionchus pacificus]|uniref:Cytochrome P450 n=1 Tax=Pristionchus pacificus TaxID=54126 RepID=A0A8R1YI73_PRIPA|nr:hypothetical protein PRIPAC_78202 [Pristionchus pacificus]
MLLFLLAILAILAFAAYYFGINRILGELAPLHFPSEILVEIFLEWKARYGRIFTVWLPYPTVVIGDHKVLHEHVAKVGILSWKQRKFAQKTLHDVGFGSAALETVHHYEQEIVNRWRMSVDKEVDVTENTDSLTSGIKRYRVGNERAIQSAVGNIVWNITFGITLEFDNPLLIKFRQLQQDLSPLMSGPIMMFIETFPFLLKLDFLLGNKFKQLQDLSEEINNYLKDAVKTTEGSFNSDNQASSYVEAFSDEQKKGSYRKAIRKFSLRADDKFRGNATGSRIRNDDQKLLPFMCAFLQEVYRLGKVLPLNFIRKTMQDTEIEGHQIRAGTSVLPQFSMVHTDPNEFERPDYFCSETLASLRSRSGDVHVSIPPPIEFTAGFSRALTDFIVKIQPRN